MPGTRVRFVRRLTGTSVVLALVLTSGAACARGSGDDASSQAATASTRTLVTLLRQRALDFDAHDTPAELGTDATLTVVGTVQSVDDGRVFGAGPTREDEPVFLNVLLTVEVESVLAGDAARVHHGVVYVELPRSKETSVAEVRRAMPAGQRLVLFLDDYTEGLDAFPLIENAAALPADETVFAPYAEGVLVEDDTSGELVGGYEPLDDLKPTWRQGTGSVHAFVTKHFHRR